MTFKKAWAKKRGKTAPDMKATTAKAKSTEKDTMCGAMEVYIKVTGTSTKSRGMAPISGLMAANMQVSGLKTKCTATVFTRGQMAEVMKECMKMI